jgi:hypothetical protein
MALHEHDNGELELASARVTGAFAILVEALRDRDFTTDEVQDAVLNLLITTMLQKFGTSCQDIASELDSLLPQLKVAAALNIAKLQRADPPPP